MNIMWMFDVETVGIESNAGILSFAAIPWSFDEDVSYEEYLSRALFVKMDLSEQLTALKRTFDKSSIDFWKKQPEYARKKSYLPSTEDVSAKEGIDLLEQYVKKHSTESRPYAWARGGLDQVTIDSLTRAVRGPDADPIFDYNRWMDVRTAIAFTKETAGGGYCQIPGFNREVVVKHDPVHDCAYDIMMLVKGK